MMGPNHGQGASGSSGLTSSTISMITMILCDLRNHSQQSPTHLGIDIVKTLIVPKETLTKQLVFKYRSPNLVLHRKGLVHGVPAAEVDNP